MKYPTQDEAQTVVDALAACIEVYTGGSSDTPIAKIMSNHHNAILGEFNRIFKSPETSPWTTEMKRNKRVVKWNNDSEASTKIMGESD